MGFTPPLAAGPYSFLFQQTGTAVRFHADFVLAPVPALAWNLDADGNWSTAANWTGGEPNGIGAAASFLGAITAPRTVSLDAGKTVGSLIFDNAQSYTLAGAGPLRINSDAAAMIDVVNGSHTISAPLSIATSESVTKVGAGTLTISGAQTHGAGAVLVASAGTTNLNSDAGTNLSLEANAAVNLGATQHLGEVKIGAGATLQLTIGPSKSLSTPALTIAGTPAAPTGKLDLTTNSAIINYLGTSPADAVRQQILAGRGGAGLGKTWNGTGITSSAAAAAEAETRSVGYAENISLPLGAYTTFRGQQVDDTTVLIAFTWTGDANLDGVVNDDDVTIVGATYAPGVAQASWARGDFDYNGFVDDDDVTLLGVFYDPSAAPVGGPPAEPGAGAVAAVPEPATLILSIMGGIAIGAFVRRPRD
jgi:autotransporter-associated beta strand protein